MSKSIINQNNTYCTIDFNLYEGFGNKDGSLKAKGENFQSHYVLFQSLNINLKRGNVFSMCYGYGSSSSKETRRNL